MSVNKVIIVGNLGRDPEMRYTQSGMAVASLAIATSRKWKNKQTNELQEETEWHRVSVFGQTAEACNNFLAKGRQVYVEGRLKTSSYDKEGVKHYSTEIVADTVQFLGGKEGGAPSQGGGQQGGRQPSGRGGQSGGGQQSRGQHSAAPDQYDPGEYTPPSGDFDDGIPF